MGHKLTYLFLLSALFWVVLGVLSKEIHSSSNESKNLNEHNNDNEKHQVDNNDKHMGKQDKKQNAQNNQERKMNEEKNKDDMNIELNDSEGTFEKSSNELEINEKKNDLPNKELKHEKLFENNLLDNIKKLFEHKSKTDLKEFQLLKGPKVDIDKDELVNILINQIKEYKERINTLEKKKSRFNFLSNVMIVLNATLLAFLLFFGFTFYIGRKHYKDSKVKKECAHFDNEESLGFYQNVPYVIKKFVKKPFGFMSNDTVYGTNKNKYIQEYLESQQMQVPLREEDLYYCEDQEIHSDLKNLKKNVSTDTVNDDFPLGDMERSVDAEHFNLLSPETASFTTLGNSRSSSIPSLEELNDNVNVDDV